MSHAVTTTLNEGQIRDTASDLLKLNNGVAKYRICGNCMDPLIKHSDSVIVQPAAHYLPGDIVVFADSQQSFVAHRLLGKLWFKGQTKYLTKPDRESNPDPLISAKQICGRVTKINAKPLNIPLLKRCSSLVQLGICTTKLGMRKLVGYRKPDNGLIET